MTHFSIPHCMVKVAQKFAVFWFLQSWDSFVKTTEINDHSGISVKIVNVAVVECKYSSCVSLIIQCTLNLMYSYGISFTNKQTH